MLEYVNEMANWTVDEVIAARDDPTKPIVIRKAAQRWLDDADAWGIVNQTNGSVVARSQAEVTQRYIRVVQLPPDDNRN